MSVVIETTLGDITVDLYLEQRPRTCLNFLKLCKIKYYNLCVFHKVERNFIAQTGDPTQTGRGGESIFCRLYGEQAKYFDTELKPRLKHEKLGTLSMVNNGNNMNGAQFFITLGENLTYLDEVHTVFGEVAEGMETLLKINEAICDPNDRPYQDIRITHTVILHDSYEDPTGLDIPPSSPIPTKEQLQSNYIGADEEIDDTKGKNMEEIEEKIKESEAKARATILEMVGDIPDADVKPPENVLFVCKLNPVTTSEDLEVIFSRFGSIVSCEVIKDRKTDESLQYAFIEFENEEDCESAYFKMDNVLIDDRRIHVDFSQSVSKMKFEHAQSQKKQSLVLKNKNKNKNKDNYDMIFDLDDNNASKEVVHSQEEKQQKFNKNSMHKEKKDCRPNSTEKHSDDMSNYKKSKNSKSDSRTNRSRSCDRQSRYGNSMHGSKKEKSHFSRTSELKQLDLQHKTKVPTAHRPKSYSSSHTLKDSTKPLFDAEQFNYKGRKRSSSVSSNSSSSNKDIIKKSAKKLNIEKSSDRTTKKQKPRQQYSSSSSDSSSSSSSSSPSKKSIKKKSSDVSSKKKTHKKRYSSSSSDSSSSSSTSDSSTPSEKNSKRSKTKRKESIPKSTQSGKSYKTKEESMESHHARKKHKIRTELKYYNDSDTLRSSSSVNLPRKREEKSRAPHYDKQSYRSKARSRSPT